MALQDAFLNPLWLAAALATVPVVVLYLVRPDPERVELPTFRFLAAEERQRTTTPVLEQLSRSLLLALQVLAILLVAAALAGPYVTVAERTVVEETILVVDTSASMATEADGATRFDRALAAARDEITETTTVVTTAGGVVSRRAAPSTTRQALDRLAVTDAPDDLGAAITRARALATEDVRIVVLSDFAGDGWTDAVATARARGLSVGLQQFDRGGGGNVGFVDRRFSGSGVTLSVRNFGDRSVTRTVALGSRRQRVELGPGDVGTVTFPVPAGGGRATLSPGDDFPTDDAVFFAAPDDPTVDALVLTNDRNRFLITALEVADQVNVTVRTPPTTVESGYDVIVYSNVDSEALLPGNVEAGRDVLAEGGGVAVQAQSDRPGYDGLALLNSQGIDTSAAIRRTVETELTRGIDFQSPGRYERGALREGRALVELRDGTPLIATARRDEGRLLWYGYFEEDSNFKFNYQYPVFWRRASFYLAGRQSLSELNHETGATVEFDRDDVEGPDGRVRGPTVELRSAGFYLGERRESASLLDESESAVGATGLADRPDPAGNLTRTERRTVPRRLTEFVALAALLVALVEIGYVRYRGEL